MTAFDAPSSLASPPPAGVDKLDHPNPIWVVLVVGGLTMLGLQGFNADFYAWWTENMHALPAQTYWRWLFLGCIPIHVAEAIYCFRLAKRLGLEASAAGWSASAFFLGWPATSLLRRRAVAAN